MKFLLTVPGWRPIAAVAFLTAASLFGLQAHADNALPTVTIKDATAREGSLITFIARLDKPNPTRQSLQFSWRTRGVTATPGQDYSDYEYTTSFGPGESESEINLITTRDDLDEGSETFELVASDPRGLVLGNTVATATIEDPPRRTISNLPVVSILSGSGIAEGKDATFTLVASPRPATPLRVSVSIGQTGSFLASGQAGRRTVTIPSRGQASFPVRTTDDGRNEAPGSVDVTVNSGSGYRVSPNARYRSASVDVTDNDRPVVTIGSGPKISEGGTARFTLWASPRPAAPIAVKVTATQKGEFASQGQLGERTVTVGTNGRGTLGVATDSDTRDEDDGFITANLGSGRAYTVGAPASARVDVTDGGAPTPRISVRAISSTIVEGGTASFELAASPRPASPLDVRVEITDSGQFASQGEAGTRTVTIGTNGRATIGVETENDLVSEPDGSLTARVLASSGYLVAGSGRASVQVRDESIKVRIGSAGDIVEGGTANFTLTAYPAPPESLVVEVRITENGSFLRDGAETRHITVGTDGRASFSVDTINDEQVEGDGAIVATVEGGYGYAPGSPGRATARVSDSTPTITIAAGPNVLEGDTATFALTARPAPERNLAVRLKVTEVAGGSFVPSGELGERDVTIYTDGTGTLELSTEDDRTDEGGGTITAAILADEDGYYRIGSPRSATLRVNDDDHGRAELTVSVGDAEVEEGKRDETGRRRLAFPVTLSKPASRWVTVFFQTGPREESGTVAATPDVDYRASGYLAARWVRFAPGVTERFIHVEIYDDDEYEADPETFELVISRVWNVEIADGRAIGTILPDPLDAPRGTPVVTIAAQGAVEEGKPATFTLRAEPAPAEDLVVQVRVFDDSIGTPESDYLAESDEGLRDVTIPGVSTRLFQYYKDSLATLTLQTVDDARDEAGGKIFVQVETAGDGRYDASGESYSAEVGVRDNDGPRPSVTPAISIADAEAYESDGTIRFDVTLNPAVPFGAGPMTVDYRTLSWGSYPGNAKRDVDFEGKHGTLTFYEGESLKQIEVRIFEDQHDEGRETFHVYLRNARGGARIADYLALGAIVNSDPLPGEWLARFGRTVAEQALAGIADRITAARTPGIRGNLGGQALTFGRKQGSADNPASGSAAAGGSVMPGVAMSSLTGIAGPFDNGAVARPGALKMRTKSGHELRLGSYFSLTGETDPAGGSMAFWGRASQAYFDGRDGGLALDGDVTTTMLGADYARDRWLVGLALAQSSGDGGYRDSMGTGKVEASLAAAIPYAALQASDRLQFWGALGQGSGDMTLTPDGGDAMKADTDWSMAAFGVQGDLFDPASDGLKLALVSDVMWAGMSSEKTADLVASDSDTTRLRLGLEGSWTIRQAGGGSLTPKLEAGVRQDGGDAENGLGVELGGGIAWQDPGIGLRLDLQGRTLVAHDEDGFKDRAVSASIVFDPDPASEQGLSFALHQEMGGQAEGGLDALFAPEPLSERGGSTPESRWETEAVYGFPTFGGRFTGSPHVGFGLAAGARDYSLGWRLTPAANAPDLSFGVKATRRESDTAAAEHMVGFEVNARW